MTSSRFAYVVAVSLTMASSIFAEDAEPAAKAASNKVPQTAFTALPLCRSAEGNAEVCLPNGDWQAIEEGRFYPLGCSYRTHKNSRLVVAFGAESTACIEGEASFGTRFQEVGSSDARTVILMSGTLNLDLADNLPEGKFFVTAPGFTVRNPAGESRYVYEEMGDGDKVTVRCVTGALGVGGRHFDIPVMRAANEVIIRSTHDHLSTILYGTSGDYAVKLDQGICSKEDIDDEGKVKSVDAKREMEWRLSPATRIVINRLLPAIGERMSVHTMAIDAAGTLKSECSFCEGRAEVNSGELVAKEKTDGEELAKRAAEATETTEAADVEEKPAADNENKNNENSTQE